MERRVTRTTIDDLLADTRRRLVRLDPRAASRALAEGARLVDIRSEAQIRRDGVIPGVLMIESLAAATLQRLGFTRATDLDGGFGAWRAAGYPVKPA